MNIFQITIENEINELYIKNQLHSNNWFSFVFNYYFNTTSSYLCSLINPNL